MELYIIIGVVVFFIISRYFAYYLANLSSGSMSGHPVTSFRDRGEKPTGLTYFGCLLWSSPIVMLWPICLIYYLFAKSQLTLSQKENELIRKHLKFYQDLDNYNRRATTDEQKRFMRVCRGIERPETNHEIAYMKYRRLQNS